jgi:hypothetical protein
MNRSRGSLAHVSHVVTLALAFSLTALGAGCTSTSPGNPDAGPPQPDAPSGDARDAGCVCDPGDGGFNGATVSLACFCDGTFGSCPGYDAELANCSGTFPGMARLEEYAGCNLAVISSPGGYTGRQYVYDLATHQIVGARRWSDVAELTCGTGHAFGYNAGVFPAASCERTKVVERCGGDGGDARPDADAGDADASDVPPDAGDAGCPCDPTDAGFGAGSLSLSCFCSREFDICRGYDAALADCFGAFPTSTCTRTRIVDRCARDAGDAGDATPNPG